MNKSIFSESKGFDVLYSICKSIVKFTGQLENSPDCQKSVWYLQD